MLSNVLLVLPLIPLKLEFAHKYIICTLYLFVKIESHMSNASVSFGRVRRPAGRRAACSAGGVTAAAVSCMR